MFSFQQPSSSTNTLFRGYQCHTLFSISSHSSPSEQLHPKSTTENGSTDKLGLLPNLRQLFKGVTESSSIHTPVAVNKKAASINEMLRKLEMAKEGSKGAGTELYMDLAMQLPSLLVPQSDKNSVTLHKDITNVRKIRADESNTSMTHHTNTVTYYKLLYELPNLRDSSSVRNNIPRPSHSAETTVKYDLLPMSRLQLTGGFLPYVPCKVRGLS